MYNINTLLEELYYIYMLFTYNKRMYIYTYKQENYFLQHLEGEPSPVLVEGVAEQHEERHRKEEADERDGDHGIAEEHLPNALAPRVIPLQQPFKIGVRRGAGPPCWSRGSPDSPRRTRGA